MDGLESVKKKQQVAAPWEGAAGAVLPALFGGGSFDLAPV
jgi:hypothetical protein